MDDADGHRAGRRAMSDTWVVWGSVWELEWMECIQASGVGDGKAIVCDFLSTESLNEGDGGKK